MQNFFGKMNTAVGNPQQYDRANDCAITRSTVSQELSELQKIVPKTFLKCSYSDTDDLAR